MRFYFPILFSYLSRDERNENPSTSSLDSESFVVSPAQSLKNEKFTLLRQKIIIRGQGGPRRASNSHQREVSLVEKERYFGPKKAGILSQGKMGLRVNGGCYFASKRAGVSRQ